MDFPAAILPESQVVGTAPFGQLRATATKSCVLMTSGSRRPGIDRRVYAGGLLIELVDLLGYGVE